MHKTVSEMAKFIKSLIPTDSLDEYKLNPVFESIGEHKKIKSGVFAFKEFLITMYDQLIINGSLYEKSPKKQKDDNSSHDDVVSLAVGCPFINNVTSILINIGYYGNFSDNSVSIILNNCKVLASVAGPQGGLLTQNISFPKMIECLSFLDSCGLSFDGIDLKAKKIDLSSLDTLQVTYPGNYAVLVGLKVMAIAHNDLCTNNDYYIFQRCDYRVLINEALDITVLLKGYTRSLDEKAQGFILSLHHYYLGEGLICRMKMHYFGIIFSYMYKSNIVWEFIPTPNGSYIVTKAKNMNKYADNIKDFHPILQEKFL